jgi:Monooxygenase subunit B protein
VRLVQAKGARATYDPHSDTVVLTTQVSNTGNQTMKLVGFTTANLTFSQSNGLSVEPGAVGPRQTVSLKVTIQSKIWSEERLIRLDKPEMGIAGRLAFESDGKQTWVTTEAAVTPTTFR